MSATEVIIQTLESVPHLNSVEDPAAFFSILGGTLVATVVTYLGFNGTDDKHAARFSNPALLSKRFTQDPKSNRWSRLSSAMFEYAGAGLAIASLAGNLTYDGAVLPNQPNSNVVFIDDVSLSMNRTFDLGSSDESRSDAVRKGITSSRYGGNLAVIQAAQTNEVVFNLTRNWRTHAGELSRIQVDPNGGSLVPALEKAASLLPINNKGDHKGTIVLASDGTVEDSTDAMAREAAKLLAQGIHVKIVVPGTVTGTYHTKDNPQLIDSSAQPELFQAFGASNVTQAESVDAVKSSVAGDIKASGGGREKQPYLPLTLLGIGLFSVGFIKDKFQRIKKVI